jgi:DNA invertase Pin-like site-specific DNA recombinase
MSRAIESYYAALERLKQSRPAVVPKGTAINKDTVAMEAGKKRGTIRNRPGFEQLIADIDAAGEVSQRRRSRKDDSLKLKEAQELIISLQSENNMLKARYMSLLYLNYELANKLKAKGLDAPKFGEVVNFTVISDVPF